MIPSQADQVEPAEPVRDPGPSRFSLTPQEVGQVRDAVTALAGEVTSLALEQSTEVFRAVPAAARQLPERLLGFLEAFRREEPAGGFVLSGWAVDDAGLGRTPTHWRTLPEAENGTLAHELYLVLVASVLGDVFSWSTVQDGRLVQDLLPVRGEELDKSAGSSASVLDLHSEDAFSPLRCDYLGLLCLRNDDRVPTVYAPVDRVALTSEQRRILAEPRYVLTPDEEHVRRAAERGERPLCHRAPECCSAIRLRPTWSSTSTSSRPIPRTRRHARLWPPSPASCNATAVRSRSPPVSSSWLTTTVLCTDVGRSRLATTEETAG